MQPEVRAWQLPDRHTAVEGSLNRVFVVANLHYLIHWPTQGGYNFVSGPLADITLITAFASALYLWLRNTTATSTAAGACSGIPIPSTATQCVGSTTQTGTVCAARRTGPGSPAPACRKPATRRAEGCCFAGASEVGREGFEPSTLGLRVPCSTS